MPDKRYEDFETFTLEEAAALLKVNVEVLRRNLKNKKIPGGIKVGGSWRVHKETLRRFLAGETSSEDKE